MSVRYDLHQHAWEGFQTQLERLASAPGVRRVCEIGGGANPALPLSFVRAHGLEYTVLDISAEELAKAPEGYVKVRADITAEGLRLPGGYDLAFSKMLAEHVASGETFHRNVLNLLRPGGRAFHFFPTLYALPFAVNRALPEGLGGRLLGRLQGGRERAGRQAKFKAYYDWCRGPGRTQLARLEALGYEVVEYVGFFGYAGYFRKLPWLERAHARLNGHVAAWLTRHPVNALTSYAHMLVERRGG